MVKDLLGTRRFEQLCALEPEASRSQVWRDRMMERLIIEGELALAEFRIRWSKRNGVDSGRDFLRYFGLCQQYGPRIPIPAWEWDEPKPKPCPMCGQMTE